LSTLGRSGGQRAQKFSCLVSLGESCELERAARIANRRRRLRRLCPLCVTIKNQIKK
jgi:hypothetical protein